MVTVIFGVKSTRLYQNPQNPIPGLYALIHKHIAGFLQANEDSFGHFFFLSCLQIWLIGIKSSLLVCYVEYNQGSFFLAISISCFSP